MGAYETRTAAELVAGSPSPGLPFAIEGRGLFKRYGATQALHDVSIALERGQVTALAGENGAGKSTLIRILTGVERPDEGELLCDGAPISLHSRHEATKAGIFCVYQDQPFVGRFEIYRQIYLGYEHHFRRNGLVSDALMRRACRTLLDELGLSWISPSREMGALSPAAREVVALAGVIAVAQLLEVEHPVILLDEPTSALSVEELEFLKKFIDMLKARSALMFVSHRVAEVLEWSDAIWVLRDGRNADFITRETASLDRVHRAMGGFLKRQEETTRAAVSEHRAEPVPADAPAATVRFAVPAVRLRAGGPAFNVSVSRGEIVGLAGVEGSGKEDFLRSCIGIVGDASHESATVYIDGDPHRRRLRDLLRAGVIYLSGERQRDGVFGRLSIAENMAISRRVAAGRTGLAINRAEERARADRLRSTLAVKTPDVSAPLNSLSGGNQQKVLLGRCLEVKPRVMLLDNVTRGVDVGAKEGIYELLRSLAQDGVSLVLASDDLDDELAVVADRILVFKDGAVVREFDNAHRDVDTLEVLAAMV